MVFSVCREVYEFPLSQSEMALQTLNLHICRYDSYSRRTSIGDVFLALAELSAQGIDFTREVFLCRNIISHQEVGSNFKIFLRHYRKMEISRILLRVHHSLFSSPLSCKRQNDVRISHRRKIKAIVDLFPFFFSCCVSEEVKVNFPQSSLLCIC